MFKATKSCYLQIASAKCIDHCIAIYYSLLNLRYSMLWENVIPSRDLNKKNRNQKYFSVTFLLGKVEPFYVCD